MPIKLDPLGETESSCPTGGGTPIQDEEEEQIPSGTPGNVALDPVDEVEPICALTPTGFSYGFFGGSAGEGQARAAILTDHGDLDGLEDDDHPQYQLRDEKGEDSGYAELDLTGKIPADQHGDQPGGSLHALATDTIAGFMSPSDKDTIDDLVFPLPVHLGGTGVITVGEIKSLLGIIPSEDVFPVNVIDTLIFNLSIAPTAGTENVYLNGQWLQRGTGYDYTISGTTVTLLRPTRPGDLVSVRYTHS